MKNQVYRFTIRADDAGQRIDQVLPRYADELSRTQLRKLIDLGAVHLAGRRLGQCGTIVQAGQTVEIFIDGLPHYEWILSEHEILFQDRYLLVINKPAGIDTQPTPARFKGTVYHALRTYLAAGEMSNPQLGMVQRLDRGTSGVMVFSIHKAAHKGLTTALTQRQADKRYLAFVAGELPTDRGEFRSLLARNRASNLVRSVARGGREAITRYTVLCRLANTTLVEVQLVTGRTHQVRVHFAEAGFPLLGDVRYGGMEFMTGYRFLHPMLHAWQLALKHPVEAVNLHFTAPLSKAWRLVWKQLAGTESGLDELLATRSGLPNHGVDPDSTAERQESD